MKTENGNKRTKRKEIQFNEAEYAVVEQKANAARLSVAAFIREAALGKELSAALSLVLKTVDIHPPKTGMSVHFSCSLS